jgi:beta-galactosidase
MRHAVLILMACACLLPAQAQETDPPRQAQTLNAGWQYAPGSIEGAEAPTFDDSDWTTVHLPHTWNAEDAFDEDDLSYRRGVGWYRRSLTVADSLDGRRLFLYFEGANQVADVYVNGTHAGQHVGGYTAFAYEITDLVNVGGENAIAVRVNNEHDLDIPPLDADFTFYGGIYRDVRLLATAPVHVEVTNHASPGVFIDTPTATRDSATVRVRTGLVNKSGAAADVTLAHRIRDEEGTVVDSLVTTRLVAAGETVDVTQTTPPLQDPHLWSPSDPYLYEVETLVRTNGQVVDRVVEPLGIRWVAADGDGFYLNGEPLTLKGTNRHQDRPGRGNAIPDAAHREDLRIIDEMGFNFLRLAHYPQDPVVLEEADRRGLLVWEEIPVVNRITMSEAFGDNAEQRLTEMIRQHYNHPSVAMWGYMNEIMLAPPDPAPEGYYDAVFNLAQRLERRAQREDSTRLTATAQSFNEIYNGKGVSDLPDVLGMNLYFGWYYEEMEGLGPFLDSLHQSHPKRPLLVSEYGAGSDERVHAADPKRFDFSTEYQQRIHETAFRQMTARSYMAGSAVWNQFDFGSNHRQDTKPAINQKGLYFFDRTPKDVAAYYRAHLRDSTVLHIATRTRARRAGSRPADRRQPITVYTNLDSVALHLNGRPVGTNAVENARAEWTVPLRAGDNTLVARAPEGGATDRGTVHYVDRTGFFAEGEEGPATMAVNAGGHYDYTDRYDTLWEADRSGTDPWGHQGGGSTRTHHRIFNTDEEPLFQSARTGETTYRFAVPPGRYAVELGFAEPTHDGAGKRVFDVRLNGRRVIEDLDLAGEFGRYRATRRQFEVRVGEGEVLTLSLTAEEGSPLVNAVHLTRRP